MPKLLLTLVALLAIGGSAAGASVYLLTRDERVVEVQPPAVQATATPTAVTPATPTPAPTSTITIRFVRDGEPVKIGLAAEIKQIIADGIICRFLVPQAAVESSGFFTEWPLPPEEGQPVQCTKGPPTNLRFEFLSLDFGLLSTEFTWTGSDVAVDIEAPELTPSPTPTLQGLPATGGNGSQPPDMSPPGALTR